MKAAIYHGIGDVRVEDVEKPEIGAGELLVRVRVCAICGGDLRTFRHGHPKIHPPVILGHEFVGTVAEVGAGAPYRVGERVTAAPAIGCGACTYCRAGHTHLCAQRETIGFSMDGAFAEYVRIPARAVALGNVQRVPGSVDDFAAALTEPLACVVNGQEALHIGAGDRVAVIGAGPIGILHAELARAQGAGRIFLLNRSRSRLDAARNLNYDAYIETGDDGGVQAVLDATGGTGADVVIVTVGSVDAQQVGISMTARMGRVLLFAGLPQGAPPLPLDVNMLHYRQIALYGAFSSAPRHNARALALIRSGAVRIAQILTHAAALAEIARGFSLVEGRAGMRVLVLPHAEEMDEVFARYPHIIR